MLRTSEGPATPEEYLWWRVAARVVADALGHTGLAEEVAHDRAMREARRWFRIGEEDPNVEVERYPGPEDLFDLAGVDFRAVRREVLSVQPGQRT